MNKSIQPDALYCASVNNTSRQKPLTAKSQTALKANAMYSALDFILVIFEIRNKAKK